MRINVFAFLIVLGARSLILSSDLEWIQIESDAEAHPLVYTNPHLSADGRYVVCEVREPASPKEKNRNKTIVLFDRLQKSIRKIDLPGERSNEAPQISDNGRYTAYHSYPLENVKEFSPKFSQIYVFDRLLNTSFLQLFGKGASPQSGENLSPAVNSDSRFIAFTSNSEHYTESSDLSVRQVYLFDRQFNSLEWISKSPATGEPGNRMSGDLRLSQNGRYVAYKSASTNLISTAPLSDLSFHLYVFDRRDRRLERIDQPMGEYNPTRYVLGSYDMDGAGKVFVFEGRDRSVTHPLAILTHVELFLFDRSSGTVQLLTDGIFSKKSFSPTLSGDGRYLGFVFRGFHENGDGGLIVYDIATKVWRMVVKGPCHNPVFSQDGHLLAFESDLENLVPGAPKDLRQVYVVKNPFLP